nr:nif-specific transcriptional activator NifA [Oryzibacter oryziterrae]
MTSTSAQPIKEARATAEMALFGIYEISKILNTPARLEVTLANVVNILTSFLLMRRGMIVVIDEAGDPEIVATAGWAGEVKGQPLDSLPQLVIDRIVATTTPLVIQDIARDPLFSETAQAAGNRVSFIGVPIKDSAKVIGTLSIDRVWDGSSEIRIDEDLRFLSMVANLVGQAVRLHRIVAADRRRLIDERSRLEKALDETPLKTARHAGGIVGESRPVRRVLETIGVVAPTNSTVLLRGESGTGKEMFARAIHELSTRKAKPFIKLNCAAMSESVLESELFGHEKGAFTGAVATKPGRFELAHGGTLLLDEIGEISPAFQSKLLRVLQEGEFERVGGTRTLKVDVRLICATNRNLEEAVAKGEFRADLYYRINVVPIALPPLRERPGDIPLLARSFLDRFNKENGRKLQMTQGGVDLLCKCYFPGNVRELENCIRRTATLSRHDAIQRDDFACAHGECLSATLWTGGKKSAEDQVTALARGGGVSPVVARSVPPPVAPVPVVSVVEAPQVADAAGDRLCEHAGPDCPAFNGRLTEKDRLLDAMEKTGWVQAKAARLLGITPRQIGYALKKYHIEMKRF